MGTLPKSFDTSPSESSILTRSLRTHISQLRKHETVASPPFETHTQRLMAHVDAEGESDAIPDDKYIMSDTLDHISAGKRSVFSRPESSPDQTRNFDHGGCTLCCCVSPLTPQQHRQATETPGRTGSLRDHFCRDAFILPSQAGSIPRVCDSRDVTTQPSIPRVN